jgi:hypothetical protein
MYKDENGNINSASVVSYLLKYYSAKNLNLTEDDIWQPEALLEPTSFNINVYLENSASMDAYVTGVTDFETAIYNLLGDFKISNVCDSLNLNYINNSIPYSKKNALPSDIQDFIEKLEPSTFRQKGGDRSVSDLKNIINTVLNRVNDQNVSKKGSIKQIGIVAKRTRSMSMMGSMMYSNDSKVISKMTYTSYFPLIGRNKSTNNFYEYRYT